MPYQAYDIARLHARDAVFLARYLRQFARDRGSKRLLVCNSFPKSGTHMLYQILYGIPGWQRWDSILSVQALAGLMNTEAHLRWKLGSIPDGSIVRAHLMHSPEIVGMLQRYEVRHFFIYRDLRDVAVSHARWVPREKRSYLHPIYRDHLTSDAERLMTSIRGLPIGRPFGSNKSLPDIGQRFRMWQGWLNDPETLAIRFEDLVGERGGGSEAKRLETVSAILGHSALDEPTTPRIESFGSRQLDPRESHTFKKGGSGLIGSWRQCFTEEHKDAFKCVAGDVLIALGYETDLNW